MENTTPQITAIFNEEQTKSSVTPEGSNMGEKAGKIILVLGIVKLVGDFIAIILKFLQL